MKCISDFKTDNFYLNVKLRVDGDDEEQQHDEEEEVKPKKT